MNHGGNIYVGCVLDVLRCMAPASVHCAVTSPPYWALRDYGLPPSQWGDGWRGCLGLEPDPEMFLGHLVEVFRELRRVLRPDGTLWVNLGDCFSQGKKGASCGFDPKQEARRFGVRPTENGGSGLPAGSQLLMPHRFALAMQADGWRLRSTIVWHKASPMPESLSGWRWVRCRIKTKPQVKGKQNGAVFQARSRDMSNGQYLGSAEYIPCPGCAKCEPHGGYVLRRGSWRPTTAHEYVFLFSASDRYFCDGEAVAEKATYSDSGRQSKARGELGGKGSPMPGREPFRSITATRNPRSVLKLANEPFKGAHFAAFPSRLPKFCIEAGTSPQVCAACGAPWAPIVRKERIATRPGLDTKDTGDRLLSGNRDGERHVARTVVEGYRPTCDCGAAAAPAVVLDPFLGTGTTVQAARALGRSGVGIERSPAYVQLALARINTLPKWALPQPERKAKPTKKRRAERLLF